MPPRAKSNALDNAAESSVPGVSQTRKRQRGRSVADSQSDKRQCQQIDNIDLTQDTIVVNAVEREIIQQLELQHMPLQPTQSAQASGAGLVGNVNALSGDSAAVRRMLQQPSNTQTSVATALPSAGNEIARATAPRREKPIDDMATTSANLLGYLLGVERWRRYPLHTKYKLSEQQRPPLFIDAFTQLKKALDLLFPGSKNPLANFVTTSMAAYLTGPVERFALSWVGYYYTRVG
ncbi:hypothetical protein G7054_g5416 [Neopestalotiopsis clavispora]|nr:hypothetical protein G7054_g5416 [Neopestalotiopsis clavispora]